jgi:hypothetical protein
MQLRIIDFNYPFQDATTVTGSSEDSEFPASNLKAAIRGKVWRSSGTFVITAGSNDKINFKESGGGAERTGTVAAGTYTSTTLAAAIKAAMEGAAGATGTLYGQLFAFDRQVDDRKLSRFPFAAFEYRDERRHLRLELDRVLGPLRPHGRRHLHRREHRDPHGGGSGLRFDHD